MSLLFSPSIFNKMIALLRIIPSFPLCKPALFPRRSGRMTNFAAEENQSAGGVFLSRVLSTWLSLSMLSGSQVCPRQVVTFLLSSVGLPFHSLSSPRGSTFCPPCFPSFLFHLPLPCPPRVTSYSTSFLLLTSTTKNWVALFTLKTRCVIRLSYLRTLEL